MGSLYAQAQRVDSLPDTPAVTDSDASQLTKLEMLKHWTGIVGFGDVQGLGRPESHTYSYTTNVTNTPAS